MKMHNLSKKTLAIFLSLAMLMSCMVWSGVSAATGEIDFDFETNPNSYYSDTAASGNNINRNGHSAMRAQKAEGVAHSGTYVMELISTAAINSSFPYVGPAFRVADTDDVPYTPAVGSWLKISFYYNIQSVATAGKTSRLVAHSAQKSWSGTNNQGQAGTVLATFTSESATNEWVYVEALHRVDQNASLHLGMQHDTGAAGATVWLDDLKVQTAEVTDVSHVLNYVGATTTTKTLEVGAAYTPAAPTRANHTFQGWYTDAACTVPYEGTVIKDMTLYAAWSASAIYEPNFDDASSAAYYDTLVDSSGIKLYANVSKDILGTQIRGIRGGLVDQDDRGKVMFLEYYDPATNADEADQVLTGDANDAGFRIHNNSGAGFSIGGVVTVTFDYKVESISGEMPLSLAIGSRPWQSGWNPSPAHIAGDPLVLNEKTETGVWKSASLGVYYPSSTSGLHLTLNTTKSVEERAGTKIYIDNVKVYYGSPVTLVYNDGITADATRYVPAGQAFDAPVPTRQGYSFDGWYIDKACTVKATTWTAGATYYAAWKASQSVSFIAFDCGGVMEQADLAGEPGETPVLPTGLTTKGYRLEGWYLDANYASPATDVVFPATGETTTLYAKWITTAEVTFSTGLGSVVDAVTVDTGAPIAAPAAPSRTNYIFDGWYTDEGCQTAYDLNTAVESDMTLYAKWKADYKAYSNGNIMTFQETNDLTYYEYDTKEAHHSGRTASIDVDSDGNASLRYDLTAEAQNGNFNRPRVIVKTGDARGNDNLLVTPGAAYEVTFKVKSSILMNGTFNYWIATVNNLEKFRTDYGSGTTAGEQGARVIQLEKATSLAVDNWTTITATIDSLVACGDASTPQYLAIGFTHSGTTNLTARTLWIDDITVTRTDVALEPTAEMGTMDFEAIGGMEYYSATQVGSKFTEVVSDPADVTNHVLRLNVAKGINGNFARHRVALQPGNAAKNGVYAVKAGDAVVVSFRVKVSKAMQKFTYWVGTMTDLSKLHTETASSGLANPYRTMQVGYQLGDMALAYSKDGKSAAAGTANEYYLGALEADTWYEYKLYIPSVVAHGSDAEATQYLVLAPGSQDADPNASDDWVNQAIYLDDITVTTLQDTAALENQVSAWMQLNDKTFGTTDESLVYVDEKTNTEKSFVRLGAKYVTADAEGFSTLRLGNATYTIKQRGILLGAKGADLHVVNNEGTYDKSADAIGWTNPTDMAATYWTFDEGTKQVSYTLAVTFSKASKDMSLAFRAYMIVEMGGVETVLYSDTIDTVTVSGEATDLSGQSLYESACELNNTTYGWFAE